MAKSIIKCPHCGSTSVVLKDRSSETIAAQRNTWQCGNCHKNFGFLSFTQEKAAGRRVLPVGKNYENVVCVGFSVGGYFGGYDQTIIVHGNHGSALCAIHTPFDIDDDGIFIREFSNREWKALMSELFEKLFIHKWKRSYVDNRVCDGTQWEISI